MNTTSTTTRYKNTSYLVTQAGGVTAFADKLGKSQSQASQFAGSMPIKGIGNKIARQIEEAFDKPTGWLDTAHVELWTDEQHAEGLGVAVTSDQLTDEDKEQRIWLNVYDIRFCCGDGGSIEFHYDVIKKKELPFEQAFFTKRKVKPENVILAYANNDSNEPYIFDGDLFGMDISDTNIKDGEMYAIYFGGQAMLKQIFFEEKGKLRLHSINTKYPDRFVTEENGTDFRVIGRQFYRSG